jgi:dipeptide/tripeptide permease
MIVQGVVLLTLSSWVPGLQPDIGQDASALQLAALFGALGVIALGTGGIKPNVSAFGADQFDETDPQVRQQLLAQLTGTHQLLRVVWTLSVLLPVTSTHSTHI